jgi:hypothetical protein
MLLALLFFFSILIISAYTIIWVSCKSKQSEPLNDLVHNLVNYDAYYKYGCLTELTVLLYSLLVLYYCSERAASIFNFVSLLLLFRSASFCLTILPKCDRHKLAHKEVSLWRVYEYYSRPYDLGGTNDLLFSGHVSILVVLSKCLVDFAKFNAYVIWPWTVMLSCLVVVLKKHYSIDVLYAYIVTLYGFSLYF